MTGNLLDLESSGEVVPSFQYDALDTATATDLRDVAERVRQRTTRITEAIIETGNDLLGIKDRLEHGQFLAWVEAELRMPARTAQQYMQAAAWAADKGATVAHLPPSTVYKLSAKSMPPEVGAEVVQRIEEGRPLTVDEIESRIQVARDDAKAQRQAQQRIAQAKGRSHARSTGTPEERRAKAGAAAERERRRIEAEERERAERTAHRAALTAEATTLITSGLSAGMSAEAVGRLLEILDDDVGVYLPEVLRAARGTNL